MQRVRSRFLALALSNRGVLHAVAGERAKAHEDFTAALQIGKFTRVTRMNIARLGGATADNA